MKIIWFALGLLCLSSFSSSVSSAETFQEVTVKEGDTLWGIANYYLKDPKKWPEILKYNKLSLTDPTAALPGMKLKVPVLLIKEELRKASLIYILNDVRYRKKDAPDWIKAEDNSELYNDYGLRTLDESRANVRFYSGAILKLDQNSLVVLRPELKTEEVNLLAGTLQAGRLKLVTQTAQVTPMTKDTLYKARLRIDKGLIVQVERGSTEVLGTFTGRKVIVHAHHATVTFPTKGPGEPVKSDKLSDLQTAELDSSNRVIVPAGHANITLPGKAPSIPIKVPDLPDFQMVDFNESGQAVVPSLYAKKEESSEDRNFQGVAPIKGYRPGKGRLPPTGDSRQETGDMSPSEGISGETGESRGGGSPGETASHGRIRAPKPGEESQVGRGRPGKGEISSLPGKPWGESDHVRPESGKSSEAKTAAQNRTAYRVQFSPDPRFSKLVVNKVVPVGEIDPINDQNDYGTPDGNYYRRIAYLDENKKEGAYITLPTLEVDKLPPVIRLFKPPENFETRQKFVSIEGQTKQRSFVRINDYQVSIKPDGRFTGSVLLAEGPNKIKIVVTDRKGRVANSERTVVKLQSLEFEKKGEEE